MNNPGTAYIIENLGLALAAANQEIAALRQQLAEATKAEPAAEPAKTD